VNREHRQLLSGVTASDFIDYLETLHLTVIHLTGQTHTQERVRYGWHQPSAFEVAQSLQKSAYISHRSAVFLHDLADDTQHRVYVNIEQGPKQKSTGGLSQAGINQAFQGKQRQSWYLSEASES